MSHIVISGEFNRPNGEFDKNSSNSVKVKKKKPHSLRQETIAHPGCSGFYGTVSPARW